ncbi:MAG TPA: S8 family serine peptidase [Thermoanaerobaculia bacterium]|jgi:subtilisin family serine protease
MDLQQLMALRPLIDTTEGSAGVVLGLIDGPVDAAHPDFARARLLPLGGGACQPAGGACRHGTFLAGMLAARRGSPAPAIAPGCPVVIRPIFGDGPPGSAPAATPDELARALTEVIAAGARVVNLSLASPPSLAVSSEVSSACELACQRGVIVVAAAGNQRALGRAASLAHPWVLPVAGCDAAGRLAAGSNLSPSIGRRGLLAPSVSVVSTAPGGGYGHGQGTSVAAAWVSGAIALLWSLVPAASASEVVAALRPASPGLHRRLAPPLLDAAAAWQRLRLLTERKGD